jgi:hypothetical protein
MASHPPPSDAAASHRLARTVFLLTTGGALAFVALVVIFVLR